MALYNPPGGWLDIRNAKTAAYTLVPGDSGKTVALAGAAFYTVDAPAASGFRPDFVCALLNEDTGRAKRVSLDGIASFLLYPGQTAFVYITGGVWTVERNNRWKLTAATSFYVDGASGALTNDGLASGAGAFATIPQAIAAITANVDINNQAATISVADGTYTAAVTLSPVTGMGAGSLTLSGNVGTPANCVISVISGNGIRLAPGAIATVTGFKILTTTSGDAIQCDGGRLLLGPMEYGACAGNHIRALNNGYINPVSNYAITGGATTHWGATALGVISAPGRTITLTGTPNFTTAFAQSFNLGTIVPSSSCVFVGAATGTRYSVSLNAVIRVDGAGAAYLPGSVAGAPATGGQYA